MITLENFYRGTPELYDIDLLQMEVGGGETTYEEIESIAQFPNAKSIIISGLRQETFEYFIDNFGDQFEAISFWKNKAVKDLSSLAKLENIKYISYFYNQKASDLWDMSGNKQLTGLSIMDFSKLKSISKIETSKSLKYFRLGNEVFDKMEIDSLKPLKNTNITHFEWLGKKVLDGDLKCLAEGNIRVLDMNPTRFTMMELAELLSCFPSTLEGSITKPYVTGGVVSREGKTVYYHLCKGKKKCEKGVDDERFAKYLEEFSTLLESYRVPQYGHNL